MVATERDSKLSARDAAKFTVLVALFAIFFDAAVGHGLAWENDPYWTYWITKTFLIATIFGLGTYWAGIGGGKGTVITAAHTLVLTVYYWSLSPIGLPSSPEWLDLEHTWITGVPIHFGVIFLGYLAALWIWRRRGRIPSDAEDSSTVAQAALLEGVLIVLVAGALSSLALGGFPGATWFVVRLLITTTFLFGWWSFVGRDMKAAYAGAVVLALVWAAYGHYLGPSGLPDLPLRILEKGAPGATAEWLGYKQLWLLSFPIWLIVMAVVLSIDARRRGGSVTRATATAMASLVTVFGLAGFAGARVQDGTNTSVSSSGPVKVETGDPFSGSFDDSTGSISIAATDMGGRVSPLPPHDKLLVKAQVQTTDGEVTVESDQPMIADPMGEHTTWWGVGFHVTHHGRSGIGTSKLPSIKSEIAIFGLATLKLNGDVIAQGVPLHAMTVDNVAQVPGRLEIDAGDENYPIDALSSKHLRAVWPTFKGGVPSGPRNARYLGGVVVLLALLAAAAALVRTETRAH
ncbi:MAG: hypothetical protein ABR507_12405 [Actinomycetota bacterium]